MSSNKVTRRVSFTSFAVEKYIDFEPDENEIQFLVWQTEVCPDTRRRHIQGYVELKKPKRLTGIKKLFDDNTMHIEASRGSAEQNIAYATKEESRAEGDDYHTVTFGEPCTQGKRSDIIAYVEAIKRGAPDRQLLDEHPSAYVRYRHARRDVRKALGGEPRNPSTEPDVRIYWGTTGSGKTVRARHVTGGSPYMKDESKWWDNYVTGQCVVLDDFRDDWWPLDYLLRLLDRYPMQVSPQ